ncbi:MAG: fumarylacetoacetate hydrolase family protein [Acetobacteraceae bacterium]|nr:fumarylacetoacetate hydrolase family protein [Acetobacteraceae bacterium]
MKLCRFDGNRLGVAEGDMLRDVTPVTEALPSLRWPLPPGDLLIAHLPALLPRIAALAPSAPTVPLSSVRIESPVANPNKIIAAPVNYWKHIEESRADAGINYGSDVKAIDHYGLFLKANSSLNGPSAEVPIARPERRTDHEIELAVVIGSGGYRIPEASALEHVAGYAIGLDMTIRGTEDRSYRKSLDGFTVLGPWLVTPDEVPDPDNLDFRLRVGNETRQESNTKHLIFGVRKLIAYASEAYTLYPGDIILTGTPEGVGPVKPGDVMHCWVERIGEMTVGVRAA